MQTKQERKLRRKQKMYEAGRVARGLTPQPKARKIITPDVVKAKKRTVFINMSKAPTILVDTVDVRSKEFLNTRTWLELRYQVFLRDGNFCRCCGATRESGACLQVDHIKPRSTHPHLATSLSNLQVLCLKCNLGKSNWDHTKW